MPPFLWSRKDWMYILRAGKQSRADQKSFDPNLPNLYEAFISRFEFGILLIPKFSVDRFMSCKLCFTKAGVTGCAVYLW